MPRLTQSKLRKILAEGLKLRDPEFRLETYGGRISGSIISPSFKRKRDYARQRAIWDVLDKALGPGSVKLVGMLLAYTPDEWYIDEELEGAANHSKRLVGK
jgi:acid stress-induced BolA-like protein IbaG/YrbA